MRSNPCVRRLTSTGSRFLNLRFLDYVAAPPSPDAHREVCVLPTEVTRRAIISLKGSSWHEGGVPALIRNYIHPVLRYFQ